MPEFAPLIVLSPPKTPTDQLRLESFKTFSRLQLIVEFKPWLDFSRDYVRRRVDSPYFLLWDCICFGAPLNTLLELLGSPTPRHLAFQVVEFDFSVSVKQREEFFASFIQRVRSLESQGRLSFGEVLKVEDFTAGLNVGFSRVLQTINRVLMALHVSYPGLFTAPHNASARRASLVQQLLDTEHKHIAKLNLVIDIATSLYDGHDPTAADPSIEGFVINCSLVVPYHNRLVKILSESASCSENEPWVSMFALHSKKLFPEMHKCYRSICTNYLTVQNLVNSADLEKKRRELANDILQNISAILSRFADYHTHLLAILEVTLPTNPSSYDGLCTAVHESHKISESINEVGHELRTMWAYQLLEPRFGSVNPLNDDPQGFGNALQDDCLLVDPVSGSFYSVFLFEKMLLCCTDHSLGNDTVNIGNTRYPVKPWGIGPALLQKHPLNVVLAIPTSCLEVLHCIDSAFFEITWGSNTECSITFYPVVQHQYTQWTSVLEPFVSRVYHSTSIPQYVEDEDGGSVYSGVSLLVIDDDLNSPTGRRRYSGGRPWSVVGRKSAHSESSSMLGVAANGADAKSVLSPTLLPTLFLNSLPNSPLRLSFMPDGDPPPPSMNRLTESQGEHTAPQNHVVNGDHLPDLTDVVIKEGPYPIAYGGYSDVWRCTWNRGGGLGDLKIVVKVLRNTTSDPATKEKMIKRLHHEMHIWKQLKHPHVLELCGTVSGFGPYTSMVCPWMKNGSVTKYLESCGDILTVEDRLRLISEVADGLAYLHSHLILHGDLTGSNVLIDDDLHARLCDFGLSTFLLNECQDDDISEPIQSVYTSHLGGSVRWADASLFRSLEEDRSPIIGTPNDIYSFGSITLEILSGRMPYHYIRTDAQVVIQLHQGVKPRRPASTFVDEDQWGLIQKCWKDPPEDRPSASQVVELTRELVGKRPSIPL